MEPDSARWWREGVFYQIYPRSFQDTNEDGVGDLRGVIERLGYLQWLGIDGIWLNPTMESPNDDWGYDVADYKSVHPDLGTMEDLDELIAEARNRDIGVVLDLVPNHTSSEHEWFKDSRSSRDSEHRDWYVWADQKPDGSPPNNWLSVFGGSAWERDEATGQAYLHNFLPSQPDFNWWNEHVRDAIDDVLRFWFDHGVAGFRIDVAHAMIKDRGLRDNLPSTERDHPMVRRLGQRSTYNMDQPEVHDVIRRWRKISEEYRRPNRILVGETFLHDLERVARYYGSDDELHLAFNFPFVFSSFEANALRSIVEKTEELVPKTCWPVWTGSNHDILRLATRWCAGDRRKIRLALMMLLTLRGTPFLYMGDEIGLPNVDVPPDATRDPVAGVFEGDPGRDPGRTPMHWNADDGAGFTSPGVEPWLPLGDQAACNVASQKEDPSSLLMFTRSLIAARRNSTDLRRGDYESLAAPPGVWAYRRGEATTVVLNFSEAEVSMPEYSGRVLCATGRETTSGTGVNALGLSPGCGVILAPS